MGHALLLAVLLFVLGRACQHSAAIPLHWIFRSSHRCQSLPQTAAAFPACADSPFSFSRRTGSWEQAFPLCVPNQGASIQKFTDDSAYLHLQLAPLKGASLEPSKFSSVDIRTAQADASSLSSHRKADRSPTTTHGRRPFSPFFLPGFASLTGMLKFGSSPFFVTASLHMYFRPTKRTRSPSVLPYRPNLPSGTATLPQFWHTSSAPLSPSALSVYRNKVRHINPVRRIKHMKRNSGRSHVHELARERYLLHRQKDVRDYYRIKLGVHEDRCPHSQRNAAVKKPDREVSESRRRENARLNAEDDERDRQQIERLTAFLNRQKDLALSAKGSVVRRQEGREDIASHGQDKADSGASISSSIGDTLASLDTVKKAYQDLQALLRKRRMLRPLGSHKLFISGVDDRLIDSDLEDFFDFFFDTTKVRLHKNADGTHRGSGIIRFQSTMDATQCLLEFNGIQIGEKRLFLGEALGPPTRPRTRVEFSPPPFPYGVSLVSGCLGPQTPGDTRSNS
ncbi:rna recognition motif-containing [Cystoisospora suis]|uniref:Rna recognition motif-containing n=1 Tax=Cystoisospora suis TaxID=483139 RepID=A0A2C6KKS8_9APIC|nr:rna recognition motif-containing [Cystoisospora suis]